MDNNETSLLEGRITLTLTRNFDIRQEERVSYDRKICAYAGFGLECNQHAIKIDEDHEDRLSICLHNKRENICRSARLKVF